MIVQPQIALLTLHGKAGQIAPVFKAAFGSDVVLTTDFNTDLLGSFTGEPPRQKTAQECAFEKANLGITLTGLNAGIGSEGSFGPSPYGFGTFNQELIAYIDLKHNWRVVGRFSGPIAVKSVDITAIKEAEHFLATVPEGQGLVIKMLNNAHHLVKGLSAADVAIMLPNWLLNGALNISYDLRAHQCPARQSHIVKAAENLVARLQSMCPSCNAPDFWPDQFETGLPCEWCETPTEKIKSRTAHCQYCLHSETYSVVESFAQPDFCPRCNP